MKKRTVIFIFLVPVLLTAAAVTVFGFVTASLRSRAIAQSGVLFDPPQIPQELMELLSSKQLLLLGETHYVQEHEDFVIRLFHQLQPHGLRFFTQELPHAFSWIAEDFVSARRNSLPPFIENFDGVWLRELRAINLSLPQEEQISYRYFDMNHGIDAAQSSLRLMAEEADLLPFLGELLSVPADTEAYRAAVSDLQMLLQEDRMEMEKIVSPFWLSRLAELVEIEMRSIPVRRKWDNHARERIIIDLTERTVIESGGALVVVNTGMYHAQKRRYMGTGQQWLGEYLAEHPELYSGEGGFYSLAFFGLSGERIRHYRDRNPRPVTGALELFPWNLAHQAASLSSGRGMFLDLSDPAFQIIAPVDFGFGPLYPVPGKQFDGYLIFPEISVRRDLLRQ